MQSMPRHLLGVSFQYYVKYFVFGDGIFVINLHAYFRFLTYIYIWYLLIVSRYLPLWAVNIMSVTCSIWPRELTLAFSSSTFCPHSVFMCFVWIWEQTAIISLYSINWLVCITETECVYCAVRTESLYLIRVKSAKCSVCTQIRCAFHASHAAHPTLVSKILANRGPPNLIFNAVGKLLTSAVRGAFKF